MKPLTDKQQAFVNEYVKDYKGGKRNSSMRVLQSPIELLFSALN
jgi:hypothetical protein